MKKQEAVNSGPIVEVSDELVELRAISEEVAQHKTRIMTLHNKGTLKDVTAEELASTIMPLFADIADAQLKHAAAMEGWLGSLEEDVDSGGSNTPDLTVEELDLFGFLLARFREIVMGMKGAEGAAPALVQGLLELEVKIDLAQKIVERLSTDDEEEEDEEDEGEEEDSEDDDAGS